MNQKALKTLEYDKIIHRLTGHAASPEQRSAARNYSLPHPSGRLNVPRRRLLTLSDVSIRRAVFPSAVSVISADPSSVSRLAAFSAWANCAKSCLFWRPLTK